MGPVAILRRRLVRGQQDEGLGPFGIALLAVVIGIIAAYAALAFRALIAGIHNLCLLGELSFVYDTNMHTAPSPLGWAVIFVPVAGAVVVVFLVRNFAPEAKGHGVPEVMDAIYYNKGVIRPIVAVVKAVVSSISIGTGGSVGREGPIIQIGAASSSWIGRLFKVSHGQLLTLIAAGGGAGIAATFNTPIAGVLFAVEILMYEVSVRTLVPVALATASATYLGQWFFGPNPAFPIPSLRLAVSAKAYLLPAYIVLGVLTALTSVAFIRLLHATEDRMERWIPGRDYLRHMVGMLIVGAISATLMAVAGHYYVQGVSYATIMDVLSGSLVSLPLLASLFVLKLFVTCLTLGSGGSGGIFSPSLFMGATLGGAFGLALDALFPGLGVDPATLALAGMAGLVGGATGAALTGIVMIFEMTLDYAVVLPMTLTVAVSFGLRRLIITESIYTMKLVRRGHPMPEALQSNAPMVRHVGGRFLSNVKVVAPDAPPDVLLPPEDGEGPSHFVVVDGEDIVGVVSREWVLSHPKTMAKAATVGDFARKDFMTLASDMPLNRLLNGLREANIAVVVASGSKRGIDGSRVLGVVTKAHLAEVIAEEMRMFER
ncbi:MAG: chloride channel protein [Planctomycetota bacterium]